MPLLWAVNPLSFIINHIDSKTLSILLLPENFIMGELFPDSENMLLNPLIVYGMHALMYRGATETDDDELATEEKENQRSELTCYGEKMITAGLLMATSGAYITKNKPFARFGVLITAIGKLALLYRGLTLPKKKMKKQSSLTKYAEIFLALGIIMEMAK